MQSFNGDHVHSDALIDEDFEEELGMAARVCATLFILNWRGFSEIHKKIYSDLSIAFMLLNNKDPDERWIDNLRDC